MVILYLARLLVKTAAHHLYSHWKCMRVQFLHILVTLFTIFFLFIATVVSVKYYFVVLLLHIPYLLMFSTF